ncbi:S-layer-related duplication domain protein [Methanosalsum zhilinae DSM 4017]|uniref:S-layer-related duplication domain protein n=1 Tax=Methanosalsum zhilinae (strain DSM 4017 / NBRC 107636 / OCM 62 / WeN5) TaxID=679901 RepID=F7XNB5_METZD|nr:S-layer protein domain-containing protein [Methanosalsum zhilinae]AEH60076.1 S-layer-related duplication domain protein [Methanosalsum zhilinae DSM 4017]
MRKLAITLVALMLMSLFAVGAATANNDDYVDELEIRGPVWDFTLTIEEVDAPNNNTTLKTFGDWRDLKIDSDTFNTSANFNVSGELFSGTELDAAQVENNVTNMTLVADAQNFAGFWYDIDDGLSSETLTLYVNKTSGDRTLDDDDSDVLVYESNVQGVNATFEFNGNVYQYPKIGFLAEEYVPVESDGPLVEYDGQGVFGDVDKLSRLLMDTDDSWTLRVGETLDLEDGYAIEPQQIDVEGDKVWLELTKDGEYVDDEIIDVSDSNDTTWFYDQTVLDEDDVVTLAISVDQVFQGTVDSLVVIEGVWQIADDGLEIETDDTFGNMAIESTSDAQIIMELDSSITLRHDTTRNVMEDLKFRMADDSDVLRFYLMQEVTEPGIHEVRGTVVDLEKDGGYYQDAVSWTATGFDVPDLEEGVAPEGFSFAGFYYDLDDNLHSEMLTIVEVERSLSDTSASDNPGIEYYSQPQIVESTFDFDGEERYYPKIGFLAEEYVPVSDELLTTEEAELEGTSVDKLSKLLMDTDDSWTLRVGQTLDLEDGYAITPQQIDVDGDKVWLELTKDGEYVDDQIIEVGDESTWFYDQTVLDEEDVTTLAIDVDQVFQGTVDSLVVIEGAWQIADDGMELETDDAFGKMVVESADDNIVMTLDTSLTLRADSTQHLMGDIYFRVSDYSDFETDARFYPFVERTVGEPVEPVEEEPVASFTANPTSGAAPLEVAFTDQSEYAVDYSWDFGDGETSTEASPTHTYEEIGTYTVTLTVSNEIGEDTAETTISVTEEEILPPVAAFDAQPLEGEVPLTVTFTDQSENAVAYEWDFGDGTTSTDATPTHTYEEAGEYTVTLTVENELGETDTAQTTITATEPEPTPGFEAIFAIAGILAVAFLARRYRK